MSRCTFIILITAKDLLRIESGRVDSSMQPPSSNSIKFVSSLSFGHGMYEIPASTSKQSFQSRPLTPFPGAHAS